MRGASENENAGNNRRLLTKKEEFCSEMLFRVLEFFASGFSCFCIDFGLGWRVLVQLKVQRFFLKIAKAPFFEGDFLDHFRF